MVLDGGWPTHPVSAGSYPVHGPSESAHGRGETFSGHRSTSASLQVFAVYYLPSFLPVGETLLFPASVAAGFDKRLSCTRKVSSPKLSKTRARSSYSESPIVKRRFLFVMPYNS